MVTLARGNAWTPPARVLAVIEAAAADHGYDAVDLTGDDTSRSIAHARFDAMARLFALRVKGGPNLSLHQIGRYLGGRDHTTVRYGLRRWNALNGGEARP